MFFKKALDQSMTADFKEGKVEAERALSRTDK